MTLLFILATATRASASSIVRTKTEPPPLSRGPSNDQWYTLMSRHSGKVLDMFRATRACIWAFAYEENQMFRFEKVPDTEVYYIYVHGWKKDVLEVSEMSTEDGGEIQRAERDNHLHQFWILEPVKDGGFRVKSVGSGKCLDVKYAIETDGNDVTQYECGQEAHQTWDIIPLC